MEENVGYIDDEVRMYKEEPNKGVYTEIADDEYGKNELKSYEFEKTDEGTITITGMTITDFCCYYGYDETVVIPAIINGASVTAIAAYASSQSSNDNYIANIVLPGTLKSIGEAAFADSELNMVEIPASVEEIGEYAFGYAIEYGNDGAETGFEKIEGFVISCYPGTAGEKYAKDNGFEYKLLSK